MSKLTTEQLENDEIYYSKKASWQYMSVSQYKNFKDCEAAALAELKGEYEPDRNVKALLVGNYVHSYFESPEAHEKFKEEHKDQLYSSRKPYGLLKDFQVADAMIEKLSNDKNFNLIWQGQHEVPLTGQIDDIDWKGKIDLLNVDKGYFVDLKTTKDIYEGKWISKDGSNIKTNFAEAYNYYLQIAIYEELLKQKYGKPFKGYIVAISKQDIPAIAGIRIREIDKQNELIMMQGSIGRIQAIKDGNIEPKRCGKCEYCRMTSSLDKFVWADELIDW